MGIKRYVADADTTITNAYDASLLTGNRGTGSNMGLSDIMEVFSLYGQNSSSTDGISQELTRALVKFPVSSIITDRTAGLLPASGSMSFYLRVFNAEHELTLPRNYNMTIQAVSRSWEEGNGLDMDNYTDKTYGGPGANWMTASEGVSWTSVGGDYHASPSYVVSFAEKGTENIGVDITQLVEEWIAGTKSNYGVGVRLSSNYEAYYSASLGVDSGSLVHNTGGGTRSYYTKRFFARNSEFFFKRPIIEARWNTSKKDDRGNFYYSSSLAPAADNLNTLFLYNYIRGRLVDIPSPGTLSVSMYSGTSTSTGPSGTALKTSTGGKLSTGIYTASVNLTGAFTKLYDVWSGSTGGEYHTGTIAPKSFAALGYNDNSNYTVTIRNIKKVYTTDETARFRLFVRDKNWNPNIYTKATTVAQTLIIPSASYKVVRLADNYEVIEHGTGSSTNHTQLSYDVSGNYFNLDMSLLEPGYMYGIKLSIYSDGVTDWRDQKSIFKFRVEEDNE